MGLRYDTYGLDQHHEPFSVDWYCAFRVEHLRRYPNADRITRDNLDTFVREAERRER